MRRATPNKAEAIAALNRSRNATGKKLESVFAVDTTTFNYEDYVDADFATHEKLITKIVREKHITTIGQISQYNDMTRLGFSLDGGVTTLTPITGIAFPQRFFCPQSEFNSNSNTEN